MAKTDQQRITDTLNFLQNTTLVPAGPVLANAFQLAQNYVNAAFPNPHAPAYSQFSQTLSLGFHLLNDPNHLRKMTRALFLLWKAMNHYDNNFIIPVQNISQISQGTVRRILTSYIYKACCIYEKLNGGANGLNLVLVGLRANPTTFLKDSKIFVFGTLLFAGGATNVRGCDFCYCSSRDRYQFHVDGIGIVEPGAINIQVESVTAFHWTDQRYAAPVPNGQQHNLNNTNFNQMTGIQLSGANYMVTTQFTGCAFCMAEHGGNMYCAHVSPSGVPNMGPNTTGNALAARLITANAAFANAGNTQVRVYGRGIASAPITAGYNIGGGGGDSTYMSIVGFPGGTSYEIYAQTTMNDQISNVTKVY